MAKATRKAKSLTHLLIEDGLVTQEQLLEALEKKKDTGKSLARTLIEMGVVSESKLTEVLAQHLGLEFVDMATYRIDMTAVALLDEKIASRHLAIPLGFDDDTLVVAMADPTNIFALDDVKMYTGHPVRPVVATKVDIEDAIRTYYREASEIEVEASAEIDASDMDDKELADAIGVAIDDEPMVRVRELHHQRGGQRGRQRHPLRPAGEGDRHKVQGRRRAPRRQEPAHKGARRPDLPRQDHDRPQHRREQDTPGRPLREDGLRQAASTSASRSCRRSSARRSSCESSTSRASFSRLNDLGYDGETLEKYEDAFLRPNGAILVTGPTGSGKSTTLYATLNVLNDETKNITTVEDPVEYRLAGINQIQINAKAGLTFSSALRSILRTSPDIIMVGEIRDLETAQIAVESALTGHLVFSTLHTNDAPGAITRLTEMGIEPFLTASGIVCVLAQRLGRRLCTCKQPYEPSEELLERLEFPIERRELRLYRPNPDGCGALRRDRLQGPHRPGGDHEDEPRDRAAHHRGSIHRRDKERRNRAGDEVHALRRLGQGQRRATSIEEVLRVVI